MTERRKDEMMESRNGEKSLQILKNGIAESRNGGKYTQILRDGIAESRNGGKYSQILKKSPKILKYGIAENQPKS